MLDGNWIHYSIYKDKAGHPCPAGDGSCIWRAARALYARARRREALAAVWASLSGRKARLELLEACLKCARRASRIQSVPIRAIRGTEGRARDFDAGFNPGANAGAYRWMRIATLRAAGIALPPVELIQVGEAYYVRDGHQRISVAHALGEHSVDAWVLHRE